MGALLRRLGEEHAVRRQDPDGIALDPCEAGDERLAVERLELVEARRVDDARDQLPRIDLMAKVLRDEAVQLGWILGPAAGGFLLQHRPLLLWPLAAGLNLACAAGALALERRLPDQVRRTPPGEPAPMPLPMSG